MRHNGFVDGGKKARNTRDCRGNIRRSDLAANHQTYLDAIGAAVDRHSTRCGDLRERHPYVAPPTLANSCNSPAEPRSNIRFAPDARAYYIHQENHMKFNSGIAAAIVMSFAIGALAGCEKGPAEKAGEKIDNAAKKVGEKVEDAGDKIKDAAKK